MLVVEKTHHINARISGQGTEAIADLIRRNYPEAEMIDDEAESVEWETTDLAKDIKARKTPGKLLRAYRERAGLSLVDLAAAAGTKYPNISAMEHDRRVIGFNIAKRLGKALNVDYRKFLD